MRVEVVVAMKSTVGVATAMCRVLVEVVAVT